MERALQVSGLEPDFQEGLGIGLSEAKAKALALIVARLTAMVLNVVQRWNWSLFHTQASPAEHLTECVWNPAVVVVIDQQGFLLVEIGNENGLHVSVLVLLRWDG